MRIKITKMVDVPISPWCGNCLRKAKGESGLLFCGVYNRFIFTNENGRILKCRECYKDLYDALERNTKP